MQIQFDELITSYIDNQVGIHDLFLPEAMAVDLKNHFITQFDADNFKQAGTGDTGHLNMDKLVRSDKIYWLDRKHNEAVENTFLSLIDAFIVYLNQTCYAGIVDAEFHYAMYEQGDFYSKHIDQFKTNNRRAFSMICYLNSNWQESDGGQLSINHNDIITNIAPTFRKCVFFKSDELPHEVLVTNAQRLSITGWLKTE